MKNIILFDDENRGNLMPFTLTRPIAEIRVGILTIAQKWEKYCSANVSSLSVSYLRNRFKTQIQNINWLCAASVIPNADIAKALLQLNPGEALFHKDVCIAACLTNTQVYSLIEQAQEDKFGISFSFPELKKTDYTDDLRRIVYPENIFSLNGKEIEADFILITKDRISQPLKGLSFVKGKKNIFIEEGAKINHASFNADAGPIYIGRDAEIMEGTIIRGPFAALDHSVTKLGTKIYGPTTLGPFCKVGGELNNVVMFGYSNKAHDGFIGNAVIGEWCNLGADTNCSNLKNNYGNVKLHHYPSAKMRDTGLQFCGLQMADHAKSGINTMFNTGTVVGPAANVYGADFPPVYIPGFAWGGASGFEKYRFDKFIETTKIIFNRRNLVLSVEDIEVLEHVFNHYSE